LAGLLAHHVLGVPVGPVFVTLAAGALFVLAVCGRRTPKRARQIVRRRESRGRRVYATGQPRRDFLEQPAVAVRITERSERPVAAMLGIASVAILPSVKCSAKRKRAKPRSSRRFTRESLFQN